MARFSSGEESRAFFDERFSHVTSEVLLEIEEEVFGTDFGATSWSTIDQIATFIIELKLTEEDRLLDIGSGPGWPALFLAKQTGCSVILCDHPFTGLLQAKKRVTRDGQNAVMVQADGAALPLANATVDAVSHSDVLCCLTQKTEVITECYRVLKPGGTLVFTVLELSETYVRDGQRDHDFGPEYASVDQPYEDLLTSTGFSVEIHDWTDVFRVTVEKVAAARESRFDRLVAELGADNAADAVIRPERNIAAIDRGDLVRRFYVCHRRNPGR
jgi:ubiquinone/menaquinone biosynthesis C-methylase UbiE